MNDYEKMISRIKHRNHIREHALSLRAGVKYRREDVSADLAVDTDALALLQQYHYALNAPVEREVAESIQILRCFYVDNDAADLLERLLRDRNFWWQQCNIAVENGRKLRSRAEELEAIFRHTHSSIGQPMGNDTCTECGLDLRDPIHRRAGEG